jgi:hypothetical protein
MKYTCPTCDGKGSVEAPQASGTQTKKKEGGCVWLPVLVLTGTILAAIGGLLDYV